jgi:hypothetical protein
MNLTAIGNIIKNNAGYVAAGIAAAVAASVTAAIPRSRRAVKRGIAHLGRRMAKMGDEK